MKKLLFIVALALIALSAAPAAVSTASASDGWRHREFEEFVIGPFEHEHRAREEAHELRERGFHTEVFYVECRGWHVKAWRRW